MDVLFGTGELCDMADSGDTRVLGRKCQSSQEALYLCFRRLADSVFATEFFWDFRICIHSRAPDTQECIPAGWSRSQFPGYVDGDAGFSEPNYSSRIHWNYLSRYAGRVYVHT